MRVGTQFTGTVPSGTSQRWFTYSWPAAWHVVWTVVPTTPNPGSPQVQWEVAVQRGAGDLLTYWVTITNVSATPVGVEARYEVLS